MNQPYVKYYNNDGVLLNPISLKYESKKLIQFIEIGGNNIPIFHPNRKERRARNKRLNCRKLTRGRVRYRSNFGL